MKDHLHDPLDKQLANLPRDIAPPRDLWAGIARSIDAGAARGAVRSPRRARPMAFAAAAAVTAACLASALTWAVLHGRPGPAPAAVPLVAARAPSFDDLQTPRYIAARDSLEHTFRERLALLDPATRAQSKPAWPSSTRRMRTSARLWLPRRRVRCSSSFGRAPGTTKSTCTITSCRRLNPP